MLDDGGREPVFLLVGNRDYPIGEISIVSSPRVRSTRPLRPVRFYCRQLEGPSFTRQRRRASWTPRSSSRRHRMTCLRAMGRRLPLAPARYRQPKGFLQPVPNTESSNSVQTGASCVCRVPPGGALPVTRLALFLTEILQHLALKIYLVPSEFTAHPRERLTHARFSRTLQVLLRRRETGRGRRFPLLLLMLALTWAVPVGAAGGSTRRATTRD